jgi:uncharacterized repeat protein (TIGR01451 family)
VVAVTLTVVSGPADLRIQKAGPETVVVGTTAAYSIVVTNEGPRPAQSVRVTDELPPGVVLVGAEPGGAWMSEGVLTWPDLPVLAAGASAGYQVTLGVEPGAQGMLTNRATVVSSTPDPDTVNNSSTFVTAVVESADVWIELSAPDSAEVGDEVTYALSVANAGPSSALNVRVEDQLPDGVTFSSAVPEPETVGEGTVAWPAVSELPAGAALTYALTAVVDSGTAGDLVNLASVAVSTPDPDLTNNSTRASTSVPAWADLGIVASGPALSLRRERIAYNAAVTNLGPQEAQDVTVTATLPAGTALVSATGEYSVAEGVVTWQLGTMTAGATASLDLSLSVDNTVPFGTRLVLVMQVSSAMGDPDSTNNRSQVSTLLLAFED